MSEPSLFTGKSIRKLLLPLVFEQLLIVVVMLVDTMMLSGISESALAGYSLVDSINQLLTQLFMAVGAGGSIVAAQFIGSRDRKGAENTANQAAMLVLFIAVLIAVPVMVFNKGILGLLYPSINAGIRGFAQEYLLISGASYIFYALYNNGTGLMYAQGYSKLSMLTSIVMYGSRILMNFLFLRVFHLEIRGLGLSILLSRLIGCVMITWMLLDQHFPIHYSRPFRFKILPDTIRRIFSIALPSGMENIIFLASKLVIGIFIAGYSGAMIAANAAANTISTYISVPANAINLATITIVSQCVGAKRHEEAKKASKSLQIATYASLLVTCSLVAVFINPLVRMLGLSEEAFGHTRHIILVYCLVSVFLWSPAFGLPNTLRAAGDNRYVMFSAVLSVVLVRVGGSFLLGNLLGLQVHGIWYAMYLDWLVRSLFFFWRFRSGKWLNHSLV